MYARPICGNDGVKEGMMCIVLKHCCKVRKLTTLQCSLNVITILFCSFLYMACYTVLCLDDLFLQSLWLGRTYFIIRTVSYFWYVTAKYFHKLYMGVR